LLPENARMQRAPTLGIMPNAVNADKSQAHASICHSCLSIGASAIIIGFRLDFGGGTLLDSLCELLKNQKDRFSPSSV